MHALTASLLSLFLMAPLASGWLGVYLSMDSKEAVVSEVIPGTPAAKAGLKSGDVLLSVGDTKTPTREKFTAAIQAKKPGTRVKIMLRREKRELVVVVKLGDRPANIGAGSVVAEQAPPRKPARNSEPPRPPKPTRSSKPTRSAPAVEVAPRGQDTVASNQKGYLGISVREGDKGLIVDRILEGGPSAKSGLKAGDVLQSVGDHRIRSLDDLDGALKKIQPGRKVPIGVLSKNAKKSLLIKVGRRPGQGRMAINEVVEIDTAKSPIRAVEIVEGGAGEAGHGIEVVRAAEAEEVAEAAEAAEEVVVEVVPAEAKPSRRVTRPGRRAAAGTAGPTGPRKIARPARPARQAQPARPARPARPAKPARPARAAQPARPAAPTVTNKPAHPSSPSRGIGVRSTGPKPVKSTEYNLERELKELRQELKELRRLLEQLRRDRG